MKHLKTCAIAGFLMLGGAGVAYADIPSVGYVQSKINAISVTGDAVGSSNNVDGVITVALQKASKTQLGVMQVGQGLMVGEADGTSNGVVSVNPGAGLGFDEDGKLQVHNVPASALNTCDPDETHVCPTPADGCAYYVCMQTGSGWDWVMVRDADPAPASGDQG